MVCLLHVFKKEIVPGILFTLGVKKKTTIDL